MKRPCLEPRCPNVTTRTRCPEHERAKQRRRDQQRGNAAARGYDHSYRTNRAAILSTWPRCTYCGHVADTVDHVVALASGGTNAMDNLVPACKRCNSSRGAKLGNARRAARGY